MEYGVIQYLGEGGKIRDFLGTFCFFIPVHPYRLTYYRLRRTESDMNTRQYKPIPRGKTTKSGYLRSVRAPTRAPPGQSRGWCKWGPDNLLSGGGAHLTHSGNSQSFRSLKPEVMNSSNPVMGNTNPEMLSLNRRGYDLFFLCMISNSLVCISMMRPGTLMIHESGHRWTSSHMEEYDR